MPIAAHDVSVVLFVRALTGLKTMLIKAEQYTVGHQLAASDLLGAQLAPDMQNLAWQAHWAAGSARLAVARLVGARPVMPQDDAKTFAELQQRIDAAIEDLRGASPSEIEAGFARVIELEHPGGRMMFTGDKFLLEFAIPTFFYHLTNAYAILGHRGVDVTRRDFLGSVSEVSRAQ
ncbi:MAG: DUF1993 domain-containing protein [Myxococcales bacterium]